MSELTIVEVNSQNDLKKFIDFPMNLYKITKITFRRLSKMKKTSGT